MSNQDEERFSFIGEARREQIAEAAIRTLDDIGYVRASLSQIAKRAGISTALISYHFADKHDLMNDVLVRLLASSESYIMGEVRREKSAGNRLKAFISASLAYQDTHAAHNNALLEIIFNARTPDQVPYYKLDDDGDDAILRELKHILQDGQENGEFGPFHIAVMASVIQGAIGEYMGFSTVTRQVDLETYTQELLRLVFRAVSFNSVISREESL